MPMSQFVDNVEKPNQFLLSKVNEQANGIGFLAYLYKVVDTYDNMMNENWDTWTFPLKVMYSEVLIELMQQIPDHTAACMKETIYDTAIALGSNYEFFGPLMVNTEI